MSGSNTSTSAAIPVSKTGRASGLAQLALASVRSHLLLWMLPLVFLTLSNYLTSGVEDPQRASVLALMRGMLFISLPTALVAMFFVRLWQFATIIKPESAIAQFAADIRYLLTSAKLWINAIPVVAAMIIHNKAALELKAAIPALNPFSWDQFFIDLDRVLHFGIDPWRLLQPFLGFAYVTFVINILYNFWFVLMFGMWFWFAFQSKHSELRDRFFFAYSLNWLIGGGIMAVLFSSAGPVYLTNLGFTDHPYKELMAYLYSVHDNVIPIWALDAQNMLWEGYSNPDKDFIGISAFPSMHNAVVTVFVCAAFGISRGFGKLILAYAAVILLGSVHLGWHYAVDGYAGIALGLICWYLSGKVARWHVRQPWVKDYRARLGQ